MNKIFLITGLLLLVFCIPNAIAQEEKLAGENEQQQVFVPAVDPIPEMDPRLSEAEREQLLQAGTDNPDKIDQATVDTKLQAHEIATEKDFGSVNTKPTGPDVDPKMRDYNVEQEVNPVPASTPERQIANETQPEGDAPDNILDRRTINGPNTQAEGEAAGDVLDRRTIKGDNDQPDGDR